MVDGAETGLKVSAFAKLLLIYWDFRHITTICRLFQRMHPKTEMKHHDCLQACGSFLF